MPEPPVQLTLRHLANVIESSDDAIVSKDLNSTIITWNRAAERMFGYTAAEAIGKSIRMIIPEDRQGEEDEVLSKIRAGRAVTHYETIRQRKDGTLLPISLTVSPVYDDAGRLIGASKIARDISERKRADLALQTFAAEAERLSAVGAVVASTLDRDGIVQKVTDAGVELTRAAFGAFFYNVQDPQSGDAYSLYAVSGTPKEAFERFPHSRATAVLATTFRGERPVRLDDVTKDPSYSQKSPFLGLPEGRLPVRSYLAVPVRGWAGDVLGGLFFGHPDVAVFTDQHERLAVGVAAWASVALENAHLYVEAREANRMKDEFLAVLSHELRTPLNAIVGYSRLLRGGMLSGEKADRGLETLERNATWLAQIVDDVLDVSRIVSGKIRLDVQPVDLALVVANAVATVQPAADAKGVRVDTINDLGTGAVTGDADRLQQVVWNLLANAVKFTARDGRVQVRLGRLESYIEIEVSDTGTGIRSDFLPYVFDRFRQADSGTTRKTGGLGLGLAIVRHIVELHGGTVHAVSAGEGLGATFSVRLPVAIVQADRPAVRWEHPPAERGRRLSELAGLSGVRVLAVDDDADALALLRTVLERAGAEVKAVGSPLKVLELIEGFKPHALVVDLGMPEMDGFELICRIRAWPTAEVRGIPATALTAFARSEDRTKALRSGFEMHLAKPVDPSELVAAVATLVRRARS